jgi:hypothetical protein
VLKIKRNEHGAIDKYKAHLVDRGFLQHEGTDFYEVFAPTAQSTSFRALVWSTCSQRGVLHQLDVSTAFLHADLEEEVYIKLPANFANGKVWRLKKALCGLRQAAYAWYNTLRSALLGLGFTIMEADPCMFYKNGTSGRVFLLFHVDDALVADTSLQLVQEAKAAIASKFKISDLGEARYFLGIEILRSPQGYYLSQEAYCRNLLQKHGFSDMKSKRTPFPQNVCLVKDGTALDDAEHAAYRSIVGGLLYLSVNTRPDISYAVGCLARYMSDPTTDHMAAAKHVMRYLIGTQTLSLYFPLITGDLAVPPPDPYARTQALYYLQVYSDADFANNKDTRKSVTGVFVCEHLAPLAWTSKLQSLVTTSTTEAEFVAAASAIKEGLWVLKLIREMHGEPHLNQMTLLCDNQAAISLMKQPSAGVQGRSKHIDVQFKFVKERCQKKHVDVEYISSTDQLADLFTKQQAPSVFAKMVQEIGLRQAPTGL